MKKIFIWSEQCQFFLFQEGWGIIAPVQKRDVVWEYFF